MGNTKTVKDAPKGKLIKVSEATHKRLKIRVAKEGGSIGDLVDKLSKTAPRQVSTGS